MDYSSYLGVGGNYDTTACMVAAAAAVNSDSHQSYPSSHYHEFNPCAHAQVDINIIVVYPVQGCDRNAIAIFLLTTSEFFGL